jgi:hypothetical protein
VIVGEYDQSFGDSPSQTESGSLEQLVINDPVPVRTVQVVASKTGTPVGGVQFNIVDEDKETVLWAGVTDKNGIAVMPVKYNPPTVSEKSHTNYIRTMLLPTGYTNPVPRTVLTNVTYSEPKVDANNLAVLYKDTSKLKPDITIKVDASAAPSKRVEISFDQAKAQDLVHTVTSRGSVAVGGLAFRVITQDGSVAKPDRNTPYFYNFSPFYWENNATTSGTIDIDQNGNIWVWTAYPMIGRLTLTPYFEGRPFPGGIGSAKKEWAIDRILASSPPYPYLYDIKHASDGGLMPAGKITADELAGGNVIEKEPDGTPVIIAPPSPSPSPGKPSGSGHTFFYIMAAVIAIGATFAYFRLKED